MMRVIGYPGRQTQERLPPFPLPSIRHHSNVVSTPRQKPPRHFIYQFGSFMGHLDPNSSKVFLTPTLIEFDEIFLTSLSNGWISSAFTSSEGFLFTFGFNEWGQLGLLKKDVGLPLVVLYPFLSSLLYLTYKAIPVPTWVRMLESVTVVQSALGRGHTIARTSEGKLLSLGHSEYGQLGTGLIGQGCHSDKFVKIDKLNYEKVIDISAGLDHSVALTENGEVFSWGFNQEAQLGLGQAEEDVSVPTKVLGIEDKIVNVAAGLDYSMAVSEKGDIWVWGNGELFQLGNGEQDIKLTPQMVSIKNQKVVKVAPGGASAIALTENGSVYSWGQGTKGQLGNETEKDQPTPKKIMFFEKYNKKVVDISGKGSHYLALTEDGGLYAWGLGTDGRLGTGDSTSVFAPTLLPFFKNKTVSFISCGLDNCLVAVEE